MITRLDGDQLTAAVLSFTNNLSPHAHGIDATAATLAAFLMPLTHEGLRNEHVKTLLELAETWLECDEESRSAFAAMEENTGAYQRHAAKALQKLRVAAMAICEGGTP